MVHVQDPFASGIQNESNASDMWHSNNSNTYSLQYQHTANYPSPYPTQDLMPVPVHYDGPISPNLIQPPHTDSNFNNNLQTIVVNTYPHTESSKLQNSDSSSNNSYAQKLEVTSISNNPFSQKEEFIHKPHDNTSPTHDKPHS